MRYKIPVFGIRVVFLGARGGEVEINDLIDKRYIGFSLLGFRCTEGIFLQSSQIGVHLFLSRNTFLLKLLFLYSQPLGSKLRSCISAKHNRKSAHQR